MTSKVPKEVRMGRLERWLKDRRLQRTLRLYGGTQTCPWCKQCAQEDNYKWRFDQSVKDPAMDVLTCGVCEGRSEWVWGLGMMYLRPLDHPAMKDIDGAG